jgi:ABC-2 type transport system permease protein
MNVIYALWLRQMKRFRRSRVRIVASLGQPVLFLLALGFGFGPVYQRAGQGNYIQFLAPGVIGMTILFASVLSGVELIWDRQFGFFKEMLVAPVPRITIMIGRSLGGASVAIVQGLLVTAICLLAGFRSVNPKGWLLALVFMALMALTFTAFGTAAASIIGDFQAFQLVVNFLVMPMFFLSGALFPLKDAPRALQIIARLDPVSYGVDGLRAALSGGGSHFGVAVDLEALCVIAAGLLALGAFLFSKIQI